MTTLGNLAIRYFCALVFYVVGQGVLTAILVSLRQGEEMGVSSGQIILNTLDFSLYPMIGAISAAVVLADLVTPRRLNLIGISLIAAFAGAYYYAMFFSYNYVSDLEVWADGALGSVLPAPVAGPVGDVLFFVAIVLPFLLLIALKLGVGIFRQERLEATVEMGTHTIS